MCIRILSVGQCGLEGPREVRSLRSSLDAAVMIADTAEQARRLATMGSFDVILVSRHLPDGTSGVDLIGELAALGGTVMLVSEHADAQEEAVIRGGLRGFPSSALLRPETIEQLRRACAGVAHG
jgi:response regulator of citrate/malate metabolism